MIVKARLEAEERVRLEMQSAVQQRMIDYHAEILKRKNIEDNSVFLFDNLTGKPVNLIRAQEDYKEAKDIRKHKFAKKLEIQPVGAELDTYQRTYVPPYKLPIVDRKKKGQAM